MYGEDCDIRSKEHILILDTHTSPIPNLCVLPMPMYQHMVHRYIPKRKKEKRKEEEEVKEESVEEDGVQRVRKNKAVEEQEEAVEEEEEAYQMFVAHSGWWEVGGSRWRQWHTYKEEGSLAMGR